MNIYEITNSVNGKKYIGQTIRPVEKRFARHINDAMSMVKDTHLTRAIRKYGPDKFSVSIIDTAENQEELTRKEQYWIRRLDTINSGYNETDATCKCGGFTYMSKSEDELRLIGDRIRQTKVGSNNPNAKAVKCLNVESGEEIFFSTAHECQVYFGEKTHRFITTRISGRTISLYKGLWKIAYANEEYREFLPRKKKPWLKTVVENIETHDTVEFPNMSSALRWTGLKKSEVDVKTILDNGSLCVSKYKFKILN